MARCDLIRVLCIFVLLVAPVIKSQDTDTSDGESSTIGPTGTPPSTSPSPPAPTNVPPPPPPATRPPTTPPTATSPPPPPSPPPSPSTPPPPPPPPVVTSRPSTSSLQQSPTAGPGSSDDPEPTPGPGTTELPPGPPTPPISGQPPSSDNSDAPSLPPADEEPDLPSAEPQPGISNLPSGSNSPTTVSPPGRSAQSKSAADSVPPSESEATTTTSFTENTANIGRLAGSIIGAIAALVLLFLIMLCFARRKRALIRSQELEARVYEVTMGSTYIALGTFRPLTTAYSTTTAHSKGKGKEPERPSPFDSHSVNIRTRSDILPGKREGTMEEGPSRQRGGVFGDVGVGEDSTLDEEMMSVSELRQQVRLLRQQVLTLRRNQRPGSLVGEDESPPGYTSDRGSPVRH
ncbi:hypothetical protein FA15DRAFT_672510 [Coprinopsis marcescibilis]|uniref:Mid2 domain-containing protein n=1 Tax=Coprinopsis marcescibilis TaxID=230819 RepID=A0A5C3KM72_COPMA|nr:hypothetical protein FA15DRAFT_672510 [Coprinopsis marcescibilis]